MKHLNPRQGITTAYTYHHLFLSRTFVSCETPKSPPGDYNSPSSFPTSESASNSRVKHLNPRQGITTEVQTEERFKGFVRVKHLNPRQGITTPSSPSPPPRLQLGGCETPKSPPGDYNTATHQSISLLSIVTCVKHLNPRQGITTQLWHARCAFAAKFV